MPPSAIPLARSSFPSSHGKPITNLGSNLRHLFKRCGIQGGHAHRSQPTFAVRMLEQGATLYDVAKILGITVSIADRYYSPYVLELQERGRRFAEKLKFLPGPALL